MVLFFVQTGRWPPAVLTQIQAEVPLPDNPLASAASYRRYPLWAGPQPIGALIV